MPTAADHRRVLALALAAAALAVAPARAAAQIPTVEPDGTLADPGAPAQAPIDPEAPPAGGDTLIPGGPAEAAPGPGEGSFYYRDDLGPGEGRSPFETFQGPVPESHLVRRGDTLWDICWFYFNNPWEWPRVWSYNPQITNPHWIYPGDRVRLHPAGQGPLAADGTLGDASLGDADPDGGERAPAARPRPAPRRGWFSLRQLAFVDQDNLKFAARVEGSTDEKLLLATGDTVYLSYQQGKPPKVGGRYAVYQQTHEVKHPVSKKKAGAYVRIVGEVEVLSVKKDKRARALIRDSVDVIERGMQVGPLKRQFRDVEPTPARVDLQGTIVAQLSADELIGARQVVFIDQGTRQGVRDGNRLFVVRRGDAYPEPGGRVSNRGLDDRRYPARAIGEILVVQAGRDTSVAQVTLSVQEIEVGDLVLMRKAGAADE